jgi:hypothetical protein
MTDVSKRSFAELAELARALDGPSYGTLARGEVRLVAALRQPRQRALLGGGRLVLAVALFVAGVVAVPVLRARKGTAIVPEPPVVVIPSAGPAPVPSLAELPAAAPAMSLSPSAPRVDRRAPPRAPSEPSAHVASAYKGWELLVAQGRSAEVVAAAKEVGLDSTIDTASPSSLSALADAARYEHDDSLAKRCYVTLRRRFPGSAEGGRSAFFLGRLMEGTSPAEAATWFETYGAESPSGPFAEDALARTMVILRTVDPGRARSAATTYLRRFPGGALAARATAIVEGR